MRSKVYGIVSDLLGDAIEDVMKAKRVYHDASVRLHLALVELRTSARVLAAVPTPEDEERLAGVRVVDADVRGLVAEQAALFVDDGRVDWMTVRPGDGLDVSEPDAKGEPEVDGFAGDGVQPIVSWDGVEACLNAWIGYDEATGHDRRTFDRGLHLVAHLRRGWTLQEYGMPDWSKVPPEPTSEVPADFDGTAEAAVDAAVAAVVARLTRRPGPVRQGAYSLPAAQAWVERFSERLRFGLEKAARR